MHFANAIAASFRLSDIGGGPLSPGPGPHARWADWNAGDCGLIPELGLKNPLEPFAPGSGRFGTPWERMQFANLRADVLAPEELALGLPEDPQAAIATAQLAAARTSDRLRRYTGSVNRTCCTERAVTPM